MLQVSKVNFKQFRKFVHCTIYCLLLQVLTMLSDKSNQLKLLTKINESSILIWMNVYLNFSDGLSIILNGIICSELWTIRT